MDMIPTTYRPVHNNVEECPKFIHYNMLEYRKSYEV